MGRLKELLVQKLDAELASWKPFFKSQIKTRNFAVIDEAYTRDKLAGYTIYPEEPDIFSAFALTAPEKAKVIIIGQDPYHGPYQAHGLAFSVRNGRPAQPSLVNIRREILSDIENAAKLEGCDLTPWARQGVLLLNSSLTVRAGSPGSHANIGWQDLTRAAVRHAVKTGTGPIVMILWGNYARAMGETALNELEISRPMVTLKSPHPSPFSADKGFFGSRPFSKTNAFLETHGASPVDWSIPGTH